MCLEKGANLLSKVEFGEVEQVILYYDLSLCMLHARGNTQTHTPISESCPKTLTCPYATHTDMKSDQGKEQKDRKKAAERQELQKQQEDKKKRK